MAVKSSLSFTSGEKNLNFRMGIIMGTCRTGKTLLGNLLATAHEVEFAEEPWLPYQLPVLAGTQVIGRDIAKDMFRTYATELINEMVLLRYANFRSNDISSIWKQKSADGIWHRLSKLNTRADARAFIETNKSLLLLALAETHVFCDFFSEAIPECKLIYVIRRGYDVAQEIAAKCWFSNEQLLKPINALLLRKVRYSGKDWHLPWWVDSDKEEMFIGFSNLERSIYYWCVQTERGLQAVKRLPGGKGCLIVKFEDLVSNPQAWANQVAEFLGVTLSPISLAAIEKVYPAQKSASIQTKIDKHLHDQLRALYAALEYPLESETIISVR